MLPRCCTDRGGLASLLVKIDGLFVYGISLLLKFQRQHQLRFLSIECEQVRLSNERLVAEIEFLLLHLERLLLSPLLGFHSVLFHDFFYATFTSTSCNGTTERSQSL